MRAKPSFGDAGFLLRLWAFLLDLSAVTVCIPLFTALANRLSLNVLQYFAAEALIGEGVTPELVEGCLAALCIALAVSFLSWFFGSAFFYGLLEAFTGASIGKHLLGLQVITDSGSHPRLTKAVLRQSAKCISWTLCGAGFLMPLWTRRKQALHDKVVRCYVVRTEEGLTLRIAGTVSLSALLLVISYPSIERSVNDARLRINTISQSYRAIGPIADVAWAIVKRGIEDLEAERERRNVSDRTPAVPPGG